MTRIILIYFILTTLTACNKANLLTYKNRKYYKESSIISSDSVFKLRQNICYNRPHIIDEEFCYYLAFTFPDTLAAKAKKRLDLSTDTTIVKCNYGVFSVWNWGDENNTVTGQIEIINWSTDGITIKENITASDFRRKETKKIIGTRTFKRAAGW